jgi:hypothetical protein
MAPISAGINKQMTMIDAPLSSQAKERHRACRQALAQASWRQDLKRLHKNAGNMANHASQREKAPSGEPWRSVVEKF